MDRKDLEDLVQVRSRMIRLYGKLEGKHEPTATVVQRDVAHEIGAMVRMVDKILKGKVEFK